MTDKDRISILLGALWTIREIMHPTAYGADYPITNKIAKIADKAIKEAAK